MFKPMSVLEVRGGEDRIYKFECAPDSPPGEIHDALCAMKSFVIKKMQEQEKKEQEQEGKKNCEIINSEAAE